jgi:hypothetical protein
MNNNLCLITPQETKRNLNTILSLTRDENQTARKGGQNRPLVRSVGPVLALLMSILYSMSVVQMLPLAANGKNTSH